MRFIGVSGAVVLFFSVCSLEGNGAWWLVTLATSAVSLGLLTVSCCRLGLFQVEERSMNSIDQSSRSR
jgi:hypothetical protein